MKVKSGDKAKRRAENTYSHPMGTRTIYFSEQIRNGDVSKLGAR